MNWSSLHRGRLARFEPQMLFFRKLKRYLLERLKLALSVAQEKLTFRWKKTKIFAL